VRILVPIKQVPDPDNSSSVQVSEDKSSLDTGSIERKANPFDEYALESALRLTEDGRQPRQRKGEVIVVTLAPSEAEVVLRAGLATGADRAIRVDSSDDQLDAQRVAHVLSVIAERNSCDLVIMGKQSTDGDGNEVGQRLAARLRWPQVTFVSRITARADGHLELEREVDGGIQRVAVRAPAIITIDLRIAAPDAVRSIDTPADFQYGVGLRFAPLPAIMQAKRKPLEVVTLAELACVYPRYLRHVRYALPAIKQGGKRVATAKQLVECLASEAKVL
jgi:electron transfer flavoprotein beta subunit